MKTDTVLDLDPRSPIPFTDNHGVPCLWVPLGRKGLSHALIWTEDYYRFVEEVGASPAWYVTDNGSGRGYVVFNRPKVPQGNRGLITVARLILGVGRRKRVRYATGDTLDLRRPNLVVEKATGRARHDAVQWLTDANEQRAAMALEAQGLPLYQHKGGALGAAEVPRHA